jgi:hypothetical protein
VKSKSIVLYASEALSLHINCQDSRQTIAKKKHFLMYNYDRSHRCAPLHKVEIIEKAQVMFVLDITVNITAIFSMHIVYFMKHSIVHP